MRSLGVAVFGLTLSLFSGCLDPSDFPVIGFDDHGNPTQVMVPEKDYAAHTTATVSAFQDSALPVLEARSAAGAWTLRTVALGVGLVTEIGVGPIARVGAAPKLRLVFSNSADPVVP